MNVPPPEPPSAGAPTTGDASSEVVEASGGVSSDVENVVGRDPHALTKTSRTAS